MLVEKTDRLYRNFKDYVILEDLDVEIHLPKEGQVIGKNAKSQAKLAHGIHLVIARNYIENLREEVMTGMRQKAEQGIFPSRPPLGYWNNRVERTIEVNPDKAPVVKRLFELYAAGGHFTKECAQSRCSRIWNSPHKRQCAICSEKSVLHWFIPLAVHAVFGHTRSPEPA